MNFIKEAENYLYHYRDLKISLNNMKYERDKMIQKNGPRDISSIELEVTGIKGTKMQDDAINVLYKIQSLTQNIINTEKRLNEVDDVLNKLDKIESTILRMWYIEKDRKEDIAELLSYTTRQIYNKKDAAIRKFAIQILGIKALEAM